MTATCRVLQNEAGYHVDLGERGLLPITLGGNPCVFGPGWTPGSVFAGFDPFLLLDLLHINGQRAVWVLDETGAFLAGEISRLDQPGRDRILEMAQAALDAVVYGFLHDPDFATDAAARDFFGLSPVVRDELSRLGCTAKLPSPEAVEIQSLDELAISLSSGDRLHLSADSLGISLRTVLQDAYREACSSGVMQFPSPVDGEPVMEMRGLAIWHVLTVWRCVDRRHGLVFFVLAAGFGAPVASIWLPGADRLVYSSVFQRGEVSMTDPSYVAPVIDHLLRLGQLLMTFLDRPVGRFAQFTWPVPAVHIGHYHWNELSGLERIVLDLEPRDYPLVYDLGGASGDCFYDDLGLVFPELAPNIELSCSTYIQMAEHAYKRGVQPFRFGDAYVSADVRRRIARVVALNPTADEAARTTRDAGGPIIVLGLRVENRTVNGLGDFYIELARQLSSRYTSLMLIIDGHNSKSGNGRHGDGESQTFSSHLEDRADRQPVEVERQIVADLRSALGDRAVKIVDCVGMTVPDNLAWMRTADFCVAPWGAGLAKYRWVLNLPTYVLISNVCKRTKGDIHIYRGADNMETPTSQVYVSEELVNDRPDLSPLVVMDSNLAPYYVNYDVEVDGVAAEIVAELDSLPIARAGWMRGS